MKKHILLAFVSFSILNAHSQKIEIVERTSSFSVGNVSSYVVSIPYALSKRVETSWKNWNKDRDGIVTEKDKEYLADNTLIKELGSGTTVDVFTRFENKKTEGAEMTVAFNLNGKYISTADAPDQSVIIKKLLKDFALAEAIDVHDKLVREQLSQLEKLQKQQADLEKDNSKYVKNIGERKEDLAKAENELATTTEALQLKKQDVAKQKTVLDASAGAVTEQVKSSQKIYDSLLDEQKDLEKKQKNLNKDILDAKKEIAENEGKLKQNEIDQTSKKSEISKKDEQVKGMQLKSVELKGEGE